MKLVLDSLNGDQLTVCVLEDFRPDEEWLRCNIKIAADCADANFDAHFKPYRFQQFHSELDTLANSRVGVAKFVSFENQLDICIRISGDTLVVADCETNDHPGGGNHLAFQLTFNAEDFFTITCEQLLKIMAVFPPDSPVA